MRAAPHSSFPPTSAPLQTLHMDVWGPSRISGQGCERYFLLVVDDYTRYNTVFPLRSKVERRIGLVMEVARTSMNHAVARHFLWPFAVRYASWVDDLATQRTSQGYTFSLGSGSVSWRSTRSSSVLSSTCEAEIYAGAMAAQELHWLTYLLTGLGERPHSSPVLYVDNKAMIALCQEHRLEPRTKHIALRYFLARELQQRGPLRLAYVTTRSNTADIFTKAFQSACFALLDWSCDHLFSPTLPMGVC
ncbi:unnamed protein product [Closterium sp. NIES-53]